MSTNQKDYLIELIDKLQKGVISKKEIEFLANFFESHQHSKEWPIDNALKLEIKKKIYKKIKTKIASERKVKVRKLYKSLVKYAAIIVVMLSVGILLKDIIGKEKPIVVKNNIEIGTDKAVLTLDDGSKVNLENGKSFTSEVLSSDGVKLLYSSDLKITSKEEVVYNYLTVPRGGEFFTQLNDGTKVWLNSESKIKYPVEFIEGETREVELIYGEAYFDVSPSTAHNDASFKVISKNQVIEVLGTQFNVKSNKGEREIITTLVDGKIAIDIAGKKEYLNPLQQSIYNLESKIVEVKEIDNAFDTAWRSGYFNFIQKPFKEVAKVLERWYNVEFSFKSEDVANLKINGVLSKNQNIEYILITLKNIENIKYQIKGNKILIK